MSSATQAIEHPQNNASELYVFIIWSRIRFKEKEILGDLREHLHVLEIHEVVWEKKNFINNLSRFYGAARFSQDLHDRGEGPFLVVTVIDKNPHYEIAETTAGHARVNSNILNLKIKHRGNLKFCIHSSIALEESRHDIALLFGKTIENYLKDSNLYKNKILKNIAGFKEWSNIEEIFFTLNQAIHYVILRDFSASPTTLKHGNDIDLLINKHSIEEVIYILNAYNIKEQLDGTFMCSLNVNRTVFFLHLHSYSYIPERWTRDIIESRILSQNNIYIPTEEHRFYSLVYQLSSWRPYVKEKYYQELRNLYMLLFPGISQEENHFDSYVQKLNSFLSERNYLRHGGAKPHFLEILSKIQEYLKNMDIHNVMPFRTDLWKPGCYFRTFTGILKNNQKILIKWGGTQRSAFKEYKILEFLKNASPSYFPKAFYYVCRYEDNQFLVREFIEGETLTKELWEKLDKKQKDKVIDSLLKIIKIFQDFNLIHRHLVPENILITKNYEAFIISNSFVIDVSEKLYKKDEYTGMPILYTLGHPYALGKCQWNDAHSIIKIFESFEEDFQKKYSDAYSELDKIRKNPQSTYYLNIRNYKYFKKRLKGRICRIIQKHLPYFKKLKRRFLLKE